MSFLTVAVGGATPLHSAVSCSHVGSGVSTGALSCCGQTQPGRTYRRTSVLVTTNEPRLRVQASVRTTSTPCGSAAPLAACSCPTFEAQNHRPAPPLSLPQEAPALPQSRRRNSEPVEDSRSRASDGPQQVPEAGQDPGSTRDPPPLAALPVGWRSSPSQSPLWPMEDLQPANCLRSASPPSGLSPPSS